MFADLRSVEGSAPSASQRLSRAAVGPYGQQVAEQAPCLGAGALCCTPQLYVHVRAGGLGVE